MLNIMKSAFGGKKIIFQASKQCNWLFVLLLLLITPYFLFAQDNENGLNTGLWKQRAYPNDTIPQDAYYTATQQKTQYNAAQGYFLYAPWKPIGPPITSSEPNGGSNAGRVASVKYDPHYSANRPYIYLAAHNGGVWKSTDGGSNFLSER
jgi:hypothetical protein